MVVEARLGKPFGIGGAGASPGLRVYARKRAEEAVPAMSAPGRPVVPAPDPEDEPEPVHR